MKRVSGAVSRLPWLLFAAALLIVGGVSLYRRHAQAPAPAPAAEAPRSRIADLTPEQIRALAARSRGAAPAQPMDMAQMMHKREQIQQRTQERIERNNTAMVKRFAGETADPAWSGAHERALAESSDTAAMHAAGVEARNFSAACKATMCRISASFPDMSAAEDWLQLYMAGVGKKLPAATAHKTTNPDGSVQVEIYGLGRK